MRRVGSATTTHARPSRAAQVLALIGTVSAPACLMDFDGMFPAAAEGGGGTGASAPATGGGGSGSGTGASAAGGGDGCPAGLDPCGGECVNTRSNPLHCGSCDAPCPDGGVCLRGACDSDCGALTDCDGACVDVAADAEHCGTCGNACGSGLVCAEGACVADCVGLEDCNGACVDLASSAANCGACGNACRGEQVCTSGHCFLDCGTETDCDGHCSDLGHDPRNCGGCGEACGPYDFCAGGACVTSCYLYAPQSEGYAQECSPGVCVDPSTDPENCGDCGIPCDPGLVCSYGYCDVECYDGTGCGGACVDTTFDPRHCGGCDHACAEGQACTNGVCTDCPELACQGFCVDPETDPYHCGGCNVYCGAGTCANGTCTCTGAGKQECGGLCVDVQKNANHCGGCGLQCGSGNHCVGGQCRLGYSVPASAAPQNQFYYSALEACGLLVNANVNDTAGLSTSTSDTAINNQSYYQVACADTLGGAFTQAACPVLANATAAAYPDHACGPSDCPASFPQGVYCQFSAYARLSASLTGKCTSASKNYCFFDP